MGWNTSVLFVRRPVERVVRDLSAMFVPASREISFEEASSWTQIDPNVAVAPTPGGAWTEVWCPSFACVLLDDYEPVRRALSADGGAVLAIYMQSVASSYGIRYYEDGTLVRSIVHGQVSVDEVGEPLAAEAGIDEPSWGYDEAWCWKIIERIVGQTTDFDTRYQVLAPAPSAPSPRPSPSPPSKSKSKSAKPKPKPKAKSKPKPKPKPKAKSKPKPKSKPAKRRG